MTMDSDTASTLSHLADDIMAVAQHPEKYELDADMHRDLLSAVEHLQALLAKLTFIES